MQWKNTIESVSDSVWQLDYPFTSKEFLSALELSGSIGDQTGWQPKYLTGQTALESQPEGLPHPEGQNDWLLTCFLKDHSYGEYVFDWGWAEAYDKYGLNYYPKLLIAAPFTPATGPRWHGQSITPSTAKSIQQFLQEQCYEFNWSSIHYLFPNHEERLAFNQGDWLQRIGVQFHWFNRDYQNFEHYLSHFKARKRKDVKKERATIEQKGINIERLAGHQIQPQDLEFFYQCYQITYMRRGMQGYLTPQAFSIMLASMGEHMILVKATLKQRPVACALYFIDGDNLYGRYWGCTHDIPALHFELCYYQGIEICIEKRLKKFDPGTQGEHKISRGFEPVITHSLHWLARPEFHSAVQNFLIEESEHILHYQLDCYDRLPFNEQHQPPLKTSLMEDK